MRTVILQATLLRIGMLLTILRRKLRQLNEKYLAV